MVVPVAVPPSGRRCYDREAECAVVEVASASDGRTLVTLMIILGGVAALYLIWLLFRLATFALPVYSAVGAGLFVHAQGYGTAAMLLAGFTTGLIVYLTGQAVLDRKSTRLNSSH